MNQETIYYNLPQLKASLRPRLTIKIGRRYTPEHFHPEAEMVYIKSGTIVCKFENEELLASAGDVIYIKGRLPHRILPTEHTAECTFLWFDARTDEADLLNRFVSSTADLPYYKFFGSSRLSAAQKVEQIVREFEEERAGNALFIKSHILYLTALLSRLGVLSERQVFLSGSANRCLKSAVSFMNSHYEKKLTLEDIAKAANVNKFYLCKLFKSLSGATLFEYINFVRIAHAEKALCDESASITEIAFNAGFSSVQYFNKVFKRYCACSPAKYRKMKTDKPA